MVLRLEIMEWNLCYDGHDHNAQWNVTENPRNLLEMNNENLVFQQNDLFPSAFPLMADIRRQGKLCDVVLKVNYTMTLSGQMTNYFLFRLTDNTSVLIK